MHRFIDLTLNGIANGAIYAAVALSLVLIWRATRILNFAQAGMLMFTTFIAWALIDHGASYWVGFIVALRQRARARRGRRARADPPGRGRAAAERGHRHARAARPAPGGRRDDLGRQPAARSRRRSRSSGYQIGGHTVLFSPLDLFIVLVGGGADGRARAAVPAHEPRAADARGGVRAGGRAAARRARRRGCSPSAGRWPRWPARWPACSSRPSVFVAPDNFDAVLVFGFTAAVLGGLESPPGAVVGGVLLGLALSYVSGYAGADDGHARRAGDPRRGADGPAEAGCSPHGAGCAVSERTLRPRTWRSPPSPA